ncbi:enoyl-CoA hydratase [Streptomyces antimycoticus]|uniref:Enoyl-CoA hydratase n=1 Tax=Streptomyces antimycoticus TaxID=68175 RepID=A0A499UNM3_9ACTN|nr:enoyl-CoA hydratase/isomerase family protein [Streptomyces antimycoticus]BBJ43494.1 enoyl-CoA hydratase [Streptomyces antimycoticus]
MVNQGKRLVVNEILPEYWRITIDNPPINLYDPEMFAELRTLMDRIEADEDLKIIVFDSANPDYFIAHYDIIRGGIVPDMPGAAKFTEWPSFVTRLANTGVVSVAAIRGRARGHGSELALACDIRFASREKAILCQVEVGVSVVPGGGATEWLTSLAGRSRALEILVGSEDFDADTAEKYGWINRAIPDAELDNFVDSFARRVARFDKGALELAKKLVNSRAGIPSEADRWSSNHSFLETSEWPSTQRTSQMILERGYCKAGDFELNLGRHLGEMER